MPYEYDSDEEHLQQWLAAEKDETDFQDFLNYYLYDCKDHEDYLIKNGGIKKIQALRRKELYPETEVVSDPL